MVRTGKLVCALVAGTVLMPAVAGIVLRQLRMFFEWGAGCQDVFACDSHAGMGKFFLLIIPVVIGVVLLLCALGWCGDRLSEWIDAS